MHKHDQKSILLSVLAEGYTITHACKKAGVSRMFYDRHYKGDPDFRKKVDQARATGRASNDDLIKTMHMKKVRDAHWPAIRYGMDKIDKREVEVKKAAKEQRDVTLPIRDIRGLIAALPEEQQQKHWAFLRELLLDATLAKDAGLLKDGTERNEEETIDPDILEHGI